LLKGGNSAPSFTKVGLQEQENSESFQPIV